MQENQRKTPRKSSQTQLDFDPEGIFIGRPAYVRKKLYYVGHAATTYSVEQAASIVDYIGQQCGCDYVLPFAVRLIENGELISIAEDNGEFGCGDILSNCLKKVEGYNVMVCVTRKVEGAFVTDMVQIQKHRAVKEAASNALDLLHEHLTNARKRAKERAAMEAAALAMNEALPSAAQNGAASAVGVNGEALEGFDKNVIIHTSSNMTNISLDVPLPSVASSLDTSGNFKMPLAAISDDINLTTPTAARR